ncbi:hypothetical protein E5R92_03810 [Candidatus Pelagibacter giovannonii]|uniref:PD-(D/E)XK endonuclease-like domain-containing protein n=1 Tax=Candidatus Pelagibacter giovannonii TaxID=2563896 RepID=A0A6H1Q257_9PROT|nr:hypothetical protein [Candidatus Pelagibacter giovannonii]QIZ20908.1 hypothetical protein E5R92_03810 [Candidatus Pelagibacter giovannonii]
MKWNRKFNYPTSSRSVINGSRHYSIEQQQLPSVTAILSRTKPEEDKAALAAWKLRMGEKESERIKNEASANGTKMHNILESYLRGRENLELLEFEEENNLAKKMADLIIAEGINGKLDEIHGVECTIYAPGSQGFAGTADLVATFESQLSICDFKQKNSIMKESYSSLHEYFTQLGAYSWGHDKVYGSTITQGVILLATKDLVFQIFRINHEKLKEYQQKFLERVELYYSLINK